MTGTQHRANGEIEMKILVFVKQVPDTDDVKLDERGNLKRDGVASMINPLDANAVEAAIQLKESTAQRSLRSAWGLLRQRTCSKRRLRSAATRHTCCPTVLSAAQTPSPPLTPFPKAPKRSATTTCCCSGATPLTAIPLRQVRRPQPFSASRRLPLHRASM